MNDFQFSDLSRVSWGPTLKLAAGRGLTTGAIVAVAFLVMGIASTSNGAPSGASLIGMTLAMPFVWAVFGPLVALLYWAAGWIVGKFVPGLGGLIGLASALVICWGDPILYFVNRRYPQLFNIADLRFLNLRPMIFVTYPA